MKLPELTAETTAKPCVLVVEDDVEYRGFLTEALEARGYTVRQATDGAEGFSIALQYHPTVIVADVVMPRVNGFNLLERLRENSRTQRIPVILISGMSDRDFIRKGMGLGADDYLTKPFRIDELCQTIDIRLQRLESLTIVREATEDDRLHNLPHFLRNPLNAILGIANLLRERAGESETCPTSEILDDLKTIEDSGHRLLEIVERLLFFEELIDLKTRVIDTEPEEADNTPKIRPMHIDAETIQSAAASGSDQFCLVIEMEPSEIAVIPEFFRRSLGDFFFEVSKALDSTKKIQITGSLDTLFYRLAIRVEDAPLDLFHSEQGLADAGALSPAFAIRVLSLVCEICGGSLIKGMSGPTTPRIEIRVPIYAGS